MWSIINNGGGQAGIYGSLDIVANAPLQALQQNSKNMVGIGMAPEGIFQNYVVFDLLAEVRVWGWAMAGRKTRAGLTRAGRR